MTSLDKNTYGVNLTLDKLNTRGRGLKNVGNITLTQASTTADEILVDNDTFKTNLLVDFAYTGVQKVEFKVLTLDNSFFPVVQWVDKDTPEESLDYVIKTSEVNAGTTYTAWNFVRDEGSGNTLAEEKFALIEFVKLN